ncbi:MAG: hypothetical protein PGN26_06815 [Xylophilus ampelinus]
MEGGKGGGAGAYWPGFVDALTNVVIAMIFVIVVLAIALSFAAQLMGKRVAESILAQAAAKAEQQAAAAAPAAPSSLTEESTQPGMQRIAVAAPPAQASVSAQLKEVRNVLRLDFDPSATALDEKATKELVAAIKDSARGQAVTIVAAGPAMSISANQRAAYQRVMAVRNVLIAQGYDPRRIESRIDAAAQASAPVVDVRFRKLP